MQMWGLFFMYPAEKLCGTSLASHSCSVFFYGSNCTQSGINLLIIILVSSTSAYQ